MARGNHKHGTHGRWTPAMDAALDELVYARGQSYGLAARAMIAAFPGCGLALTKNSISGHYHQRRKRLTSHDEAGGAGGTSGAALYVRDDWFRHWALDPVSHPRVRQLFVLMNEHRCSGSDFYKRSGLVPGTLTNWRRCCPNIANLETAFNVFGMTLLPSPLKDD